MTQEAAVGRESIDSSPTLARILDAATAEFAAHGFDGTRVGKIAERAGMNKRMIYMYWDSKQELHRDVLKRKFLAMHNVFTADWGTAPENLVRYFRGALAETELLRFVQWEALSNGDGELVAEKERSESFELRVRALERDQRRGKLTSDIPADYLMLIFMALASYPVAFSQNVRLVTGRSLDDPVFQSKWAEALGAVAEMLSPAAKQMAVD